VRCCYPGLSHEYYFSFDVCWHVLFLQVTSSALILVNNILADIRASASDDSFRNFHKWTVSDFTPWAFVSALLWVPGGTAGVYAIRHSGLAISVGVWSCVIVILSYVWGVWIFGEEQKSAWGAVRSMAALCLGLCGCAYFSSREDVVEGENGTPQKPERNTEQGGFDATEHSPLILQSVIHLDLDSQRPVDFQETEMSSSCINHTYLTSKYYTGICMAVINGILAATIMVPLHYAPVNTTYGLGYSMSFGVASVLVVVFFWLLRFIWLTSVYYYSSLMNWFDEPTKQLPSFHILLRINMDSLHKGYHQLPSFHLRVMWKAGMTSGLLYSLGNLFGIISIQKLGDFMGYSLNQTSVIISGKMQHDVLCASVFILQFLQLNWNTGMWGLLYYKEIPGTTNMIGFFASTCVVFWGILMLAGERMRHT
jgi:hypothetical protein